MAKRKGSLPYLPLLLALVAISLSAWYVIKVKNPAAKKIAINEVTSTGTTTLEASPAPTNRYLGQEFTLDINAHSGTDKVTAVQLELTYDPTKLTILSLTKTDYLPNTLSVPAYLAGSVTATFATPPDSGGKADWGTVGKIVIKPLTLGSQTIFFGGNTLVSATSSSGNVLKSVTPIVINVLNLGDINMDKKVDLFDYNLFVRDYGSTTYSLADFNNSGKVDLFDYNTFVANYGKVSP